MKLFTVGPVACYPRVLEAMSLQMYSHRSKEYLGLHYDTVERLQSFLETDNDIYLFSSTGTGFMEASVLNCVKEKMLCCVNGSFGKRYVDVAKANGKKVEVLEPSIGEPITSDILDDELQKNPEIEAVALTHNETSVGLINPLKKLVETAKTHGKLVFVDAVSSMGGTEIKVDDWGIDICFSSSQKCFGVPPGLGIGSISVESLKKSENAVYKGWYFDLKIWQRYHDRKRGTPMTSVIPQVAGLNEALKMIDENGGKSWYFNLYKRRNETIRKGIKKFGLMTFPKKGYESPTVSCIKTPKGVKGPLIYESMREKGFELAKGYGSLVNETFRIGNMGHIIEHDIEHMLDTLGFIIEKMM